MDVGFENQIQESVGLKVRDLRKSAGLSSVDLARATGISQGHLSKIETGKATISVKALSQICRHFNRPLNYLFQKEEASYILMGTLNIGEGPEKDTILWLGEELERTTGQMLSLVRLEAHQLGTVTNPVEYLHKGSLHLFMDDLYLFRKYVPEFDLFSLPYLFQDTAQHQSFLGSSIFEERFRDPLLEDRKSVV